MRGIVVLGECCVPPTLITIGNALKAEHPGSVPIRGLTGVTVGIEDTPPPPPQLTVLNPPW